jgi:hypothetical protein
LLATPSFKVMPVASTLLRRPFPGDSSSQTHAAQPGR